MENNLNVTCSSGAFQLVQNDETYRQTVASQLMEDEEGNINEVIFYPAVSAEAENVRQELTGVPEDEDFIPIEADKGDDKQNWLEAPVKLMLSLIEELRPKVGKSVKYKTKLAMYREISNRMAEKGYMFTVTQNENKFRGLERQYKKTVLNNRQGGRNRQTCQYMSELSRILGEKRCQTNLENCKPHGQQTIKM